MAHPDVAGPADTQLRYTLSEASPDAWAAAMQDAVADVHRAQQKAAERARKHPDKKPKPADPAARWSESTSWGWLTWRFDVETNGGPHLDGLGVIDAGWAKTASRRRSALAFAPDRARWVDTRFAVSIRKTRTWLAIAVAVAIVFGGVALAADAAWPIWLALLVGIVVYNLPSIVRIPARRRVRVFTGAALDATKQNLLRLLTPVATIARAVGQLPAQSADKSVLEEALSDALVAVWAATAPTVTRQGLDDIVDRLGATAAGVQQVYRSTAAVTRASTVDVTLDATGSQPTSPTTPEAESTVSRLDEVNRKLADHAAAQQDAADTIADVNRRWIRGAGGAPSAASGSDQDNP